jgi:flagellar biosynthesis protein FlhG
MQHSIVGFVHNRTHVFILRYRIKNCNYAQKRGCAILYLMQIIPVASGKGGVGKSLLSANLSIALGQSGKKVVMADLDLGASNLHLVIGQHTNPAASLGAWLTDHGNFEDIIAPTEYENVSFIAGDSQIPGLTALKPSQKTRLIHSFQNIDADYLVLDLGAGTHQIILDLFLLSPQGIVITAPTVTATLNGYLFLKNSVFRLMYTTYKKNTPGYDQLEKLRKDSTSLQRLYIPKLIEALKKVDPENTELFMSRMKAFRPRLIMNMIDDPKDADKAQRIRRSCSQYLGLEIEHLGIMYRDTLQDKALSSQLPIIVYKPQAVLSQAIYRIAEKILTSETRTFDQAYKPNEESSDSFQIAEEEANDDYDYKLSGIDDLVGSGTLTVGELAEMIKTQQYEITQLKKENLLLKSKIIQAASQGFKI